MSVQVAGHSAASARFLQEGESRVIKVMFVARRRADMSSEDFRTYWLTTHAELMKKVPGLQRYVISLAADPSSVDEVERPFDGFAEVGYADASAMRRAMESAEAKAMLADEDNLFDRSASVRLVVEDVVLVSEGDSPA